MSTWTISITHNAFENPCYAITVNSMESIRIFSCMYVYDPNIKIIIFNNDFEELFMIKVGRNSSDERVLCIENCE